MGLIEIGSCPRDFPRFWLLMFRDYAMWRDNAAFLRVRMLGVRNAGVGATGSLIGAFRYSQDVSPFKPDVLGVEFSVNDADNDEARQTMEGVIRHAMREGTAVEMSAKRDGEPVTLAEAVDECSGLPWWKFWRVCHGKDEK